jgi:hypothetical protein
MQPTTMMEIMFIVFFGVTLLGKQHRAYKPQTMRDVRARHGIDVDACDEAWEQHCKENDDDHS